MENLSIAELIKAITDAGLPVVLLILLLAGLWKLAKPFLQEIITLHREFLRSLGTQIGVIVDKVSIMANEISSLADHVKGLSDKQDKILENQAEIGRGVQELRRNYPPGPRS